MDKSRNPLKQGEPEVLFEGSRGREVHRILHEELHESGRAYFRRVDRWRRESFRRMDEWSRI